MQPQNPNPQSDSDSNQPSTPVSGTSFQPQIQPQASATSEQVAIQANGLEPSSPATVAPQQTASPRASDLPRSEMNSGVMLEGSRIVHPPTDTYPTPTSSSVLSSDGLPLHENPDNDEYNIKKERIATQSKSLSAFCRFSIYLIVIQMVYFALIIYLHNFNSKQYYGLANSNFPPKLLKSLAVYWLIFYGVQLLIYIYLLITKSRILALIITVLLMLSGWLSIIGSIPKFLIRLLSWDFSIISVIIGLCMLVWTIWVTRVVFKIAKL